jgi:hypothetical protein
VRSSARMHPTAQISIALRDEHANQLHSKAHRLISHLSVHLKRQHNLRCAVPTRRDVLCHEPNLLAARRAGLHAPRKAEVAHLEIAVGI